MPILGLEPTQFVSEEYCYCTLKGSATTSCSNLPPFHNIHPWQQS